MQTKLNCAIIIIFSIFLFEYSFSSAEFNQRYQKRRHNIINNELDEIEKYEAKQLYLELEPIYVDEEDTTQKYRPDDPEEWLDLILKHVDFGLIYDDTVNPHPQYYIETVLPIYQSTDKRHTVFTHDRVSSEGDGEFKGSVGLGYRRLVMDEEWILGINGFFDYQSLNIHYRTGLGFEVLSDNIEGRLNLYNAHSGRKLVKKTFFNNFYEEAADGFDLELGGRVPYAPWLKLYEGFTRYYFKNSEDLRTWTHRAEISAKDIFTINLQAFNNELAETNYRVDARFKFAINSLKPADILEEIKFSKTAYPKIDLKDLLLDRVERNFNIVVEKSSDSKNVLGNLTNIQLATRFPGVNCSGCLDVNGDGFVQAGDGFEIDFLLVNLGTVTSTGISYSNAQVSNGWSFTHNTDATLSNAPPGGTTQTDNASDMDLDIPAGTANGTSFDISIDVTADGQSARLNFGPFVVGSIADGQTVNLR